MRHLAPLLLLGGVALAQEPVSKEKALDLAGNVHVIFEKRCNECHGSHLKKPEGKFGHVLDLKRMADNLDYVERGKPHQSELYRLVNDGEMPPDDHPKTPPLTGEEKDIVRRWIQAGAPHELPAVLPKRVFLDPLPVATNAAGSVKGKRVTLDQRDQPPGTLFGEITKQTGVVIRYTAPKNEPRLSIRINGGTVGEVLDYLCLNGNLVLRWSGETALITPEAGTPPSP